MESKVKFKPDTGLKLMEQVRQVLRYYHYAYRTEQTYCDWIVRFIRYHGSKRHLKDMGKSEVGCDSWSAFGSVSRTSILSGASYMCGWQKGVRTALLFFRKPYTRS
jgi:hypothetical protein